MWENKMPHGDVATRPRRLGPSTTSSSPHTCFAWMPTRYWDQTIFKLLFSCSCSLSLTSIASNRSLMIHPSSPIVAMLYDVSVGVEVCQYHGSFKWCFSDLLEAALIQTPVVDRRFIQEDHSWDRGASTKYFSHQHSLKTSSLEVIA